MNHETNSSVGSSVFSTTSSSYRNLPTPPQPVLSKDSQHKPKTTGSVGIMLVGLGGYNGTTLLAGIIANRLNITWRGPLGDIRTPNYNGCITQLKMKGGGVGYKDRVKGLADATFAAVGGWVSRCLFRNNCDRFSSRLKTSWKKRLGHSTHKTGRCSFGATNSRL